MTLLDLASIKASILAQAEQALLDVAEELASEIRNNAPESQEVEHKVPQMPEELRGKGLYQTSVRFTELTGLAMEDRRREISKATGNVMTGRFSFTKLASEKNPSFRNESGGIIKGQPTYIAPSRFFAGDLSITPVAGAAPYLRKMAKYRRKRAAARARHASGTLKKSIKVVKSESSGLGSTSVTIVADTRYARYVDMGVRGNEGNRGFFSKPVENAREHIPSRVAQKIRGIE